MSAVLLNPLVPAALLQRLRESFPADIVGMARLSDKAIQQVIGEQRIIETLQTWHDEQDPFKEGG